MKRKRFMEEQIITVLREHEAGAKAADLGLASVVTCESTNGSFVRNAAVIRRTAD